MLYLDYDHNPIISASMVDFYFEQFGHRPDYEIEFNIFRIRFESSDDMTFFLLYWSDKIHAVS